MGYDLTDLIKLRLDTQKINKPKELEIEPNPCWEGYEPIGLKDDGTPNCVPIKAKIVKDGFPIPSPDSGEDEQKYISRCISDISDEYDTDQAYAICKGKWDEK
jgi:hypothetical protein